MTGAISSATGNVNDLESLKKTKEVEKENAGNATNNQKSGKDEDGLANEVSELGTKISQMRSDGSQQPQNQKNDQDEQTPIQ